ncbi:MAG TPA: ubiquinol oxidase subunit II [Candidatus Saccharimonadales bacterium]|jgi:cytochrome o ubiquinol oxidase subunit 2
MKYKTKFVTLGLIVLALLVVVARYLHRTNIPILEPRGTIGDKERNLIIFTFLLGLAVIIPVFIMTIVITVKYREGNTKSKVKYMPDWDRHRVAEVAWWGIPILIISILSVVTWVSTYALNPFKPLVSSVKPITVEVVSLDWKWLFIYPQQNIATVNFFQIPVNTPVDFEITSDSVMNSFWIPQLGGQIYSMPGMSTELHLMATSAGSYKGSSANISGSGFAGMTFVAKASSRADFNSWAQSVKHSPNQLTQAAYNKLAKSSKNNPVAYYSSVANNLYDTIVMKYMMPSSSSSEMMPVNAGSNNQTKAMPMMQGMYMP